MSRPAVSSHCPPLSNQNAFKQAPDAQPPGFPAALYPTATVNTPLSCSSNRSTQSQCLEPGRRTAASETGEDESGHIKMKQNEGILFFDNIFPLKLQWLSKIPFVNPDRSLPELLKRVNNPNVALADPMGIIQRALPSTVPSEDHRSHPSRERRWSLCQVLARL